MQSVPTGLRTHSQKVCSFYKEAARCLESWYTQYHQNREQILMLRKEIDNNANIKDLRVAKELLLRGKNILFQIQHPQPKKFPTSPGGCAYEREVEPRDWVLDFWEPMEKAQYPKYFALREKRKLEYIKLYDKLYPNAQKKWDHFH
ncbi:NADH dehydrogenase [ubiquinone] 1 beta subcomplex subunit 9 [Venturia canescens]|uniref:NADH dehydrogenase [ubiquinone] 1 beta subcomplex subunit 9 n=1 Tax=Venturia canescens TaxID=32260 RepID=UPI001C9D63EF|nr:NADH dehydrogenase [ubiquinone] 1 beta subcomplex subunit 9 [Venturia canescens]